MARKKSRKKIFISAALVAVIAIIAAVALVGAGQNGALTAKFYDKAGKPIASGSLFSVVTTSSGQQIQGVGSMALIRTVTNTGNLTLTNVGISSATPSAISNIFPTTTYTLTPGQSASWTSQQISTSQFDGSNQTFDVKVTGTYTYGGQTGTVSNDASVTYGFASDPTAGLSGTLISSISNSTGIGVTTNTTTNSTLFTSGTTCTQNSQCLSNSCVLQTFQTASYNVNNGNWGNYNRCGTGWWCDPASCISCTGSGIAATVQDSRGGTDYIFSEYGSYCKADMPVLTCQSSTMKACT
jgi:hypothetical protein